jgi:hypothetical protein
MQAFLHSLRRSLPRIAQATSSEVELVKTERGEFVVVARWGKTRLSGAGEHRVYFDRERVLGRTAGAMPHQQRPAKKTCRVADEIIREVLTARGV